MKLILNNYRPVSGNVIKRTHGARCGCYKKEAFYAVKNAINEAPSETIYPGKYPFTKAKLHFDVYLTTNRRFDEDRFWGGSIQWVIDRLVKERIIADDSHQNVKLSCEFYKDSKRPRVEVIIERLEE